MYGCFTPSSFDGHNQSSASPSIPYSDCPTEPSKQYRAEYGDVATSTVTYPMSEYGTQSELSLIPFSPLGSQSSDDGRSEYSTLPPKAIRSIHPFSSTLSILSALSFPSSSTSLHSSSPSYSITQSSIISTPVVLPPILSKPLPVYCLSSHKKLQSEFFQAEYIALETWETIRLHAEWTPPSPFPYYEVMYLTVSKGQKLEELAVEGGYSSNDEMIENQREIEKFTPYCIQSYDGMELNTEDIHSMGEEIEALEREIQQWDMTEAMTKSIDMTEGLMESIDYPRDIPPPTPYPSTSLSSIQLNDDQPSVHSSISTAVSLDAWDNETQYEEEKMTWRKFFHSICGLCTRKEDAFQSF